MLSVTDLTVNYGNVTALFDVGLTVEDGKCIIVVGPNGAGKSTLMLTIMGAVKARSGQIAFHGEDIAGREPEAIASRGISIVPEGRHIFASLTVRENLLVGESALKKTGSRKFDLDLVMQIFPVLKRRWRGAAGHLSGGEQQQLAIARALLQNPKLLLVDEPSLGLAPAIIDTVYESFQELKQKGVSLLIVEQSTARIAEIADRIYLLKSGSISGKYDPEEFGRLTNLGELYF